jgi:cytochrome bd-type quinol oxidase subunit 1
MNYPIWEVPLIGGGIVIAIVAVIHVFIAHFAVGGGLYLVLTERKAHRENDEALLSFLRGQSLFFLVLTLVAGALTGVGIWFSISLVSPDATSTLLRVFVWVWAIEWVFFFVEIISILIYYYGWDRLDPRDHVRVGWIYAGSAWMSLFLITGILSFMLTPGAWPDTRDLHDAFFNPTFWPSVVLRTAVAAALAGLYALVTGSLVADRELRERVIRYSSLWVRPAFLMIPLAGLWYFLMAPERARELPIGGSAVIQIFVVLALVFSVLIFAFTYLGAFLGARRFGLPMALLLLSMGFLVTGAGEWVREGVRKPYIIGDYMYANAIRTEDVRQIRYEGVLTRARWARVSEIEVGKEEEAGKEVFRLLCSSCHTVDGYNPVRPLVRDWSESYINFQLRNLDKLRGGVMPPFTGTDREREALAKWLAELE